MVLSFLSSENVTTALVFLFISRNLSILLSSSFMMHNSFGSPSIGLTVVELRVTDLRFKHLRRMHRYFRYIFAGLNRTVTSLYSRVKYSHVYELYSRASFVFDFYHKINRKLAFLDSS